MKTSFRHLFLGAAVALFFTLTRAALAQDKPPAPATPSGQGPVPPVEPAAAPAPAAATAPVAAPATAVVSEKVEAPKPAPAVEPASAAAPEMRRLDQPVESSRKTAPAGSKDASAPRRHSSGDERIAVGHDVHLAKDEAADAVVAVFGSATSDGEVGDAIVSVLGDARANGPVGDSAVAVLGSTYVNGKVGDTVVAVLGNVELGPEADVGGDVVVVGGTLTRDPKAVVHGDVSNVALPGLFGDVGWLRSWFYECLFYGRLLAFKPGLAWAWMVGFVALGLYVLIALAFRRGVEKCGQTLETRPGYSLLTALLTVLLSPVAIVLLIVTGVGIFLVPFIAAGMFVAALFGKVVILAWIGRRFTKLLGDGPLAHPAVGTMIGGLLMLLLYTVPVLGILLFKLLGWLGMGVVIYTLILVTKRDRSAPTAGVVPVAAGAMAGGTLPGMTAGETAAGVAAPPLVSGSTLPRAGFWIRTAALLLDVILLGIIVALTTGGGKLALFGLATYGAIMWKFKGSTIGGIICGLRVVRLDDRPIDWGTAIARALGCFLSLVVMFLGFIWVAFDNEKQSWHDKIAGTTVVRVPKGVSLLT